MFSSDTLLTYFTDGKKSVSQRIIVLILLCAAACWINDVMQFTYFYRFKNKVEILEDLTRIIGDPRTDSLCKMEAAALRKELLTEGPLFELDYGSFFLKLKGGLEKSTQKKNHNPRQLTKMMKSHSKTFSIFEIFKVLMSTSGIFFFGGLSIIAVVALKSKESLLLTLAHTAVMLCILMMIVVALTFIMLLFIPPMADLGSMYIINVTVQFLLFTSVITILMYFKNRF